jgi:hypothetical protein
LEQINVPERAFNIKKNLQNNQTTKRRDCLSHEGNAPTFANRLNLAVG